MGLGLGPAGVGQQAPVELPRGGAGEDLDDDRLPRLEVLDLGDQVPVQGLGAVGVKGVHGRGPQGQLGADKAGRRRLGFLGGLPVRPGAPIASPLGGHLPA